MNNHQRALALASAEFTTAAGAFALALLLPEGEHKKMKIGEALASIRLYANKVEASLEPAAEKRAG